MIHDFVDAVFHLLLNLVQCLRQMSLDSAVIILVTPQLLILQGLDGAAYTVNLPLIFFFLQGNVFVDVLDSLGLILQDFLHFIENSRCVAQRAILMVLVTYKAILIFEVVQHLI